MADPSVRASGDAPGAPRGTPDHPRPVPRALVLTIAVAMGAWLALMAAIAAVSGTGPGAAAGGWRLMLLKETSVVAFTVALIAAVVAILAIEARRRRS